MCPGLKIFEASLLLQLARHQKTHHSSWDPVHFHNVDSHELASVQFKITKEHIQHVQRFSDPAQMKPPLKEEQVNAVAPICNFCKTRVATVSIANAGCCAMTLDWKACLQCTLRLYSPLERPRGCPLNVPEDHTNSRPQFEMLRLIDAFPDRLPPATMSPNVLCVGTTGDGMRVSVDVSHEQQQHAVSEIRRQLHAIMSEHNTSLEFRTFFKSPCNCEVLPMWKPLSRYFTSKATFFINIFDVGAQPGFLPMDISTSTLFGRWNTMSYLKSDWFFGTAQKHTIPCLLYAWNETSYVEPNTHDDAKQWTVDPERQMLQIANDESRELQTLTTSFMHQFHDTLFEHQPYVDVRMQLRHNQQSMILFSLHTPSGSLSYRGKRYATGSIQDDSIQVKSLSNYHAIYLENATLTHEFLVAMTRQQIACFISITPQKLKEGLWNQAAHTFYDDMSRVVRSTDAHTFYR